MSELERAGVKRARLGRGLGSLLDVSGSTETATNYKTKVDIATTQPNEIKSEYPNKDMAISDEQRIWKIPIEKILVSPSQARTHFESAALNELAASIREQGVLQPVVVRRQGSGFELIAGERRWRATQIAGLKEIPAIIKSVDNRRAMELGLIENIQRADLNPIEEAMAYQRLAEEFKLTHQEISNRVGRERSTIANAVRLLALPPELQQLVAKGEISSGHAKVLLSIGDVELQLELAEKIIEERLSVRNLERHVERIQNKGSEETPQREPSKDATWIRAAAERLQKNYGTRVGIRYEDGKGDITLSFFGLDQFNELLARLEKR